MVPGVSGPDSLGWDLDPAVVGSWRSVEPPGALPHLADRVDAEAPPNEFEVGIDVDLLHVDATSFRQLLAAAAAADGVAGAVASDGAGAADGVAGAMAAAILGIVRERGKLQNPVTRSGGVARGRVTYVGARSRAGVALGDLVVPLVSLVSLPLQLDEVGPIDVGTPEVRVRGRAVITGRMPVMRVPDDLVDCALTAADVYPVASYARDRARPGDHVVVLGAGIAGLLAAVAAQAAVRESGAVTVVDVDASALARVREAVPAVHVVEADARDAVRVARVLRDRGLRPAELTLACTSARGCEGTALLVTASTGTVLFFSTATRFADAALGSDPLGTAARLELSNGVTPDHGAWTLELLRSNPVLRAAFTGTP